MKLRDICYLNLNKQQKKNFKKNYPIESSIICKYISDNISMYCKIKKKIYVIYGKTQSETDYSYKLVGYNNSN